MTGIKRMSPDSGTDTRPLKLAKTGTSKPNKKTSKKGGKRGAKPSITAETFNSTASPLYVNVTHTPPASADSETEVLIARVDSGFIQNVTLVPATFSTGSFGWKGSKRIMVEVPNSNGDEREKVQVMLSINATVLGSKPQAGEANDAVEEEENNDNESKEE